MGTANLIYPVVQVEVIPHVPLSCDKKDKGKIVDYGGRFEAEGSKLKICLIKL